MAQNDLAKEVQTSKRHSRYFHFNTLTYLKYHLNQRKNARNRKISLNKYEKGIISVGIVTTLFMMFFLVSLKITSGGYHQNIIESSSRISKVKNNNNSLHQEVIDLQKNKRLHKIAHQDQLKLSDKNIRNVR